MTKLFEWIETRLDKGAWFRRILAVVTVFLVFRMTYWATEYAEKALLAKVSLLDGAAIITAVAGIPVALLTLIFNKYVDSRS